MEDATAEGNNPEGGAGKEQDAARGELQTILAAGPGAGNRSGALAFLALLLIIAGALHYHFADGGPDSRFGRLDSALVAHAELSVAAMEDGGRTTVVPSWPLDLYENLRRNIAVYAALAAAAAFVWSQAARARARRDAFVVHERLQAELAGLRGRLERLEENRHPGENTGQNAKG